MRVDIGEAAEAASARSSLRKAMRLFERALRDPSLHVGPTQLLRSLARLRAQLPLYQDLAEPLQWNSLPIISKETLRTQPTSLINRAVRPHQIRVKTTSGTTGAPVTIVYGAAFYLQQRYLAVPKALRLAGVTVPAATVCVHLTDSPGARNEFSLDPLSNFSAYVQLALRRFATTDMARVISRLRRCSHVVLTGRPELLEILALSTQLRRRPISIVAVLSGGSMLDAARRATIEQALQARVLDTYALSEFGYVASECRRGSLHIDASSVYAEVTTPTRPATIVLSSMANDAMPLLRFATDDTGSLGTCPCGYHGAVLHLHSARHVPAFTFALSGAYAPTCFNDLAARFGITDYRIVEVARGECAVYLQAATRQRPNARQRDAIAEWLARRVRGRATFTVVSTAPSVWPSQRYSVAHRSTPDG